jgi:hypothetical protein
MSFSAMGCLQSTRALVVDTGIPRRLLGLIRQRGNPDGALEVSSDKSEICRDLPDTPLVAQFDPPLPPPIRPLAARRVAQIEPPLSPMPSSREAAGWL